MQDTWYKKPQSLLNEWWRVSSPQSVFHLSRFFILVTFTIVVRSDQSIVLGSVDELPLDLLFLEVKKAGIADKADWIPLYPGQGRLKVKSKTTRGSHGYSLDVDMDSEISVFTVSSVPGSIRQFRISSYIHHSNVDANESEQCFWIEDSKVKHCPPIRWHKKRKTYTSSLIIQQVACVEVLDLTSQRLKIIPSSCSTMVQCKFPKRKRYSGTQTYRHFVQEGVLRIWSCFSSTVSHTWLYICDLLTLGFHRSCFDAPLTSPITSCIAWKGRPNPSSREYRWVWDCSCFSQSHDHYGVHGHAWKSTRTSNRRLLSGMDDCFMGLGPLFTLRYYAVLYANHLVPVLDCNIPGKLETRG